ncbi:hypothetical protein DSO57_1015639 [Entomophthora muscae]|uniref:Uncharacterized protein n=1 Tax=Entomophthora muscae TaxID=34485 RepID=A0ACC2SUG2_9FUNG|nr:hypothetical protein DSO57_1015639 [Entomophthora muscae]
MTRLPGIRELFSSADAPSSKLTPILGLPHLVTEPYSRPYQPTFPLKPQQRQRMTAHQTLALEITFRRTHFPSSSARHYLAAQLNLSPRKIQIWFQNRRQKQRHYS